MSSAEKLKQESPNQAMPIVEVSAVNHAFGQGDGKAQVLFENNLTIYPGEIVVITGPSGSGKTTLLTLIGALRSLQEGKITVLGQQLQGLPRSELVKIRRNIGFIFQHHNLFNALTALENVKMAANLKPGTSPADKKRLATEILNELELADHLDKKPTKLSGGQRQRVAISRALVNQPQLVLADEPTAALDKVSAALVMDLLTRLAKTENSAIVIVTHDHRLLDKANRVIRMVDGCIESDIDIKDSINTIYFLQRCPVFKDLAANVLADVANKMLKQQLPAGSTIFKEGEIGDTFYIIKNGRVEITRAQEDGSPKFLARYGAGDFFGELALLNDQARSATVKTLGETEFLTLSKEIFNDVLKSSSNFENQIHRAYFL